MAHEVLNDGLKASAVDLEKADQLLSSPRSC